MGFPVPGGGCYFMVDFTAGVQAGYIRAFHLNRSLIRQHLETARANGQERIVWVICFFPGGNSHALDSTGGRLTQQDSDNLYNASLLAADLGFSEFLITMHPEWSAAWPAWPDPVKMTPLAGRAWQPERYAENMAFALRVAECMDKTGLFYRMDLHNELDCTNPIAMRYGQRLWQDWLAERGGNSGSVGFSMWPEIPGLLEAMPLLYQGLFPDLFSVHIYRNPPKTVAQVWADYKRKMIAAGFGQWSIIGESLTGDPETDAALAADPEGYFWRAVWPVGADTPEDNQQDRLTVTQQFSPAA